MEQKGLRAMLITTAVFLLVFQLFIAGIQLINGIIKPDLISVSLNEVFGTVEMVLSFIAPFLLLVVAVLALFADEKRPPILSGSILLALWALCRLTWLALLQFEVLDALFVAQNGLWVDLGLGILLGLALILVACSFRSGMMLGSAINVTILKCAVVPVFWEVCRGGFLSFKKMLVSDVAISIIATAFLVIFLFVWAARLKDEF